MFINIYLENNDIWDKGIKYLQKALKTNQGKTAMKYILLSMYLYIYI